MRTPAVICALTLLWTGGAFADHVVPVVHRGEFLAIRAGVPEVGTRPVHVGDPLSLLIEVEFDAERLRIETLDAAFFQRAFADHAAFALHSDPAVTRTNADARTTIRASWTFQIVDCPAGLLQCAGEKSYELPIIDVAYQLVDQSGIAMNDKSVRLRPWPGTISVTPSVNAVTGSPDEFAVVFPGGAYQEALPVRDRRASALLAALAGTLILGAGIRGSRRRRARPAAAFPAPRALTRWQTVLGHLETGDLPDDEWGDTMRRCITWYCLDEMSANPCEWLESGALSRARVPAGLAGLYALYSDILQEDGIAPSRRQSWLERFLHTVQNPAVAASASASH
ncbi:MAG TPA: hypothetical protein VFG91_07815 [Woeseiaceae bacterium]|nr:hypothetical protein [Woeseiaceae bacterium]